MDEFIQLLEDICALHNRALALGVNLEPFTSEAGRKINAAMDQNHKAEIAEIKNAIRRPSSGTVQ